LCLGSFLNVVISRLPKEKSLLLPASHCPKCKHKLKWIHNIPVFSYFYLKAKCAFCHKKISFVYPLVELLSGAACVFLYLHFGFDRLFIETSLFSLFLIALVFIDFEHQLLPDELTLLLLWLGLLLSILPGFTEPADAIIGAAAGYFSLWFIAKMYEFVTKREGMGYGDFKLLAALGAWAGWQALPWIVLIAALLGSAVAITLVLLKKANAKTAIAFGPYLAIAGWVVLIWGKQTFF
jgi:leader peptidase (prepilin peptidase)/N-methyltransferase